MCLVWNLNLGRASHLTSDLGKTNVFAMLMNVSVEDSSTFFAREERSSTRKSQTFVATGRCLTLSLFGKNNQKNDCAQHNKFGMSFVGQVVWDTEPGFFFSLGILFFYSRPRRFGEKKVTRNIEKKAHGLKSCIKAALD